MCTGWVLCTRMAQPCKLPRQSVNSGSQDCAGAGEPGFPLPAPIHTPLPSAGMHDFRTRLCHPRSVPCFPWCELWERRGNSHPHCRPHTWVAAGRQATLASCVFRPAGAACAVPPAWESSWEVLGDRDQGGGCSQGTGSLWPPPMQPQSLLLKSLFASLGDRKGAASVPILSLSPTLQTWAGSRSFQS